MTDEQLMRDYTINGTSNSFEELHRRYQNDLLNFLDKFMFGDFADDVSQIVWSLVHQYREQFNPEFSFRNWLYRMAAHNAQHWMERKHNRFIHLEDLNGFDSIDENLFNQGELEEVFEELSAQLGQLPAHERELIEARYFSKVPQKNLSETLGASRWALYRIEQNALQHLRDGLACA